MPTTLFEQEPLTCEVLEQEAGLRRGVISEITVYPSGAVEIETAAQLRSSQRSAVESALTKRGLIRGRKPR